MKTMITVWLALLIASSITAAEPQFKPIDGWLKPSSELTTIGPAHGDVAVSAAGEVYVSVAGPRAGLQVFSPDGSYLRNVPDAPADFHGFVIHQASDGEHIFGASLGSGTVYKMKLDGTVVMKIERSTIPEKFSRMDKGKPVIRLTAVDVAPDGRIFVVDGYSSDFIHIYDPTGKYIKSFGGKEAPYGFKTCHKIAIDTRFDPPRILCCDRENRRVVNLSLDGEVLSIVPEMKRPAAAVIFRDWAAIAEIEGRVSLLDKEGKTVLTLGANPIKEQTATNQVKPTEWRNGILTAPHGLDFDQEGNLVVSEFNAYGRVVRYDLQ